MCRIDEGSTEFLASFIPKGLRREILETVIIYSLAIPGINGKMKWLPQADFSYTLAGFVYYIRVLAIEIISLAAARTSLEIEWGTFPVA